jgi:sugar lactone lactonase YvrE
MVVQLGSGEFTFEVNENWAKVPEEIALGDVAAVGVDRQNRVYAFNRGEHPVAVFDAEGNLLRTWGEGVFHRPHGVHMGPDDTIYLTDDGDHTVRKCALDGKVLMTLGIPGEPKPYMSGEPFHRCTHTALSPQGELYVSDGYGNARIHKYTADGKLLMSWGEPGTDPGQFNIPHNICCGRDGWVYVADRENHRVQVFDGNGRFETNGTICTARTACAWQVGPTLSSISAKADQPAKSTNGLISGRASVFTRIRARCWPALARCILDWRPGSSLHPTALPWTGTATSMSASCQPGYGRGFRRTRHQSGSGLFTNS